MANEITKVELLGQNNDGNPLRFTVASGTAISKGTLLAMTDPRTAIAHSSEGQAIAGIAAMDKSSTDGSTSISVWTNWIFEVKCSGTITVGQGVIASDFANVGTLALGGTTAASGLAVWAHAIETGAEAEIINMRVNL